MPPRPLNSRSNTPSGSAARSTSCAGSGGARIGRAGFRHTREGAVDRLRTNPDQLVARRGDAAQADIARLARLSAQQQALTSATSPLGKVVAMLRDPDVPVAQAAYRDFSPAVPTNADGLAAGLIGFLTAWGGARVLSDLGLRLVRRRPRTTTRTA